MIEKKVGIFFFVENEILMDAVPVANGEPYGDAIQYSSHYEFWESLVPRTITEREFKARAYDAHPRGRVVYFPKKKKFCIYHDACLKSNAELSKVVENFGLKDMDAEFANDEHYKCAGCNPYFLD
ncbi:MAG: hypothetical protein QMD44_06250 [Thermodesulfovibrionales bacterium]|jgi:hypothetical protein|nr:hypothetical protein [Thermodesulfovibrionales bacterium]